MGIFRNEKWIFSFFQYSENCLRGEFITIVYCSAYESKQESGSFYSEIGESTEVL